MNLTRVDPVKLRHFIAVLDTGSFARAAERAEISQPAISKSIRVLEEALNLRLFERGRAGARPTRYAELLAAHARVILAEYALAEAELRAFSQADHQQIAIGASLNLAQTLLPRAIARFRRRWPDVTLSVEVGLSTPLFGRLLNGDLDLVLSAPEEGVSIDERLSRTYLLEEKDVLVVGAAHPLLKRGAISLSDLLDFPWIVPRRSNRLDRIHAVFAANRLPPPAHVLRSESSELARGLLAQEPFICLIGEGVLRSEVEAGRLAILPDLGFDNSRPAFLSIRRNSHLRAAARNLALLLQEVAREAV
ncbi:MAG TPA: LysR family transcriptional regulator [Sphingobium sp.]|uniref:LysR substrate-binding domain-containing protein n=1 Tax=Sphingobium sp. TaxID=1912891 RepID=UPI002ED3C64C